jgi:signal peptidase I
MNDGSTANQYLTGWRRLVFGRNPKFTLIRLVATILLFAVLFTFVFIPIRVTGISMLPTYRDGQLNLVNKLAYRSRPPRRGDVVAIWATGRALLLKRVIGLPGEHVIFREGVVEIDGEPLSEPYLKLKPAPWNEPFAIGPDEYLVVGDNRTMPAGFHTHFIVERWRIAGKAVF